MLQIYVPFDGLSPDLSEWLAEQAEEDERGEGYAVRRSALLAGKKNCGRRDSMDWEFWFKVISMVIEIIDEN